VVTPHRWGLAKGSIRIDVANVGLGKGCLDKGLGKGLAKGGFQDNKG